MGVSFPSTDFEHQALLIIVPDEFKEPLLPQSSRSNFSQNATTFIEAKNAFEGSSASPNDEELF